MIVLLRVLAPLLSLSMIVLVVQTSLESNLFAEWENLAAIPWLRTTLVDFYYNVLLIYLWACYRERHNGLRLLWLVLFVGLGAIATALFVAVQAYRVPRDATLAAVLLHPDDLQRLQAG